MTEYGKGYVSGILDLAAENLSGMGVSMIEARTFEKDKIAKGLEEIFGKDIMSDAVLLEDVHVEAAGILRARTEEDERAVSKVMGLLEWMLGEAEAFARFPEERQLREQISGYTGNDEFFYYVEDIALLIFKDAGVLIVIGNDE